MKSAGWCCRTPALRVLGMKPGDQVRADVSPNRIDICPEPPVMAQGVIENGVLVMVRQGIRMDAAAAVRSDRDSLAARSQPPPVSKLLRQ
ncbi:MAG: hypothetical protein EAZ65_04875 [Verrucomicrobia bacterium]|nr:MAG: hypothetical protein EAZ65_04875 [Verrucomicrobiota bacterium]